MNIKYHHIYIKKETRNKSCGFFVFMKKQSFSSIIVGNGHLLCLKDIGGRLRCRMGLFLHHKQPQQRKIESYPFLHDILKVYGLLGSFDMYVPYWS